MKRVLTAAVVLPLALAAIFFLPPLGFFVFVLLVVELAVLEYVAITGSLGSPKAMASLPVLVPLAVLFLLPEIWDGDPMLPPEYLLGWILLASGGMAAIALFSRAPVKESVVALGFLAFGLPYFVLPVASLHRLRSLDPWVVLLVAAIVWLGDTAAYYVGCHWGRRKLAPVVSPHKTWEGAVAGFVAAVAATAVWSLWRLGEVDSRLLALGAVTSIAAQVGDLVESLVKRSAGVKDSGGLLPGHGGMLDRLDSLLFAAPVLAVGLYILGWSFPQR
jgi:phosphatidate cytidylyltransferase